MELFQLKELVFSIELEWMSWEIIDETVKCWLGRARVTPGYVNLPSLSYITGLGFCCLQVSWVLEVLMRDMVPFS